MNEVTWVELRWHHEEEGLPARVQLICSTGAVLMFTGERWNQIRRAVDFMFSEGRVSLNQGDYSRVLDFEAGA